MQERLWAPWRMQYVGSVGKKEEACIFCAKPAENDDARNLIVWRSTACFVILNLYPYTSGHLMIAPYRHVGTLSELTDAEWLDMGHLMRLCLRALEHEYRPDGFNVGFNVGRAAGAGIEGHVHLHIVPRWHGDTNFMATIGETRVLPESLEQTYARLHRALQEVSQPHDGATR
ncbi:MAG: HIT domain-containing protein [Armatimonadota bacterium]|nr:HIT domain-containing protein [Armatimonadota bacterium]